MKFTLGRFVFRTKGDAVKAVRNVLNSALPGLFLRDELDLVTAVLDRHHDRENKLAGGMIGIMVQWSNEAGYLSRCFHIVRPDWSTVDFSYRVALDQAPKGPTIEQACRMAVLPDIRAYRDARLAAAPQRCDASGEPLTPLNLNVDHAGEWPFRRIIEEFVEWSTREGLSLRLAQSGIFTVEFANPQATEAFRAFHNARAVLWLVTQESIRAGSGKRLPRPPRKWETEMSHWDYSEWTRPCICGAGELTICCETENYPPGRVRTNVKVKCEHCQATCYVTKHGFGPITYSKRSDNRRPRSGCGRQA